MKKYILIYEDLDVDVRSFDTLKQLEAYCRLWQLENYTIALVYKEVQNGETSNSY